MQWFRVDLKTFLGLAMPNQYSQTVRKQISRAKIPKPSWSLYIVPPYYMIKIIFLVFKTWVEFQMMLFQLANAFSTGETSSM